MATASGRLSTTRDQRFQKPASALSERTKRLGITRTLLIRGPSTYSIAGSRVIVASTDTAGISMPAIPIERMNGSGSTTRDRRPIATVEPDTITDRPAWVIVSTTAVSRSFPAPSSSRKRKIISSE